MRTGFRIETLLLCRKACPQASVYFFRTFRHYKKGININNVHTDWIAFNFPNNCFLTEDQRNNEQVVLFELHF